MKKFLFFILTLLILFLSLTFIICYNFPRKAFVVEVTDGDTVKLQNGVLLRYLGLSTSEIREKNSQNWLDKESYWGEKAYLYNKELIQNKRVRIEYDRQKKDKYKRLLGYVFLDDIFVNAKLLQEGLAVIDIRSPNYKYADVLAKSFRQAVKDKKGIWENSECLSPEEISKYIGEIVCLKGPILDIYEGKRIILIFMPKNFKLVIFKDNIRFFNIKDLSELKGKVVKAYGLVEKHKRDFEIIIHHPYQLELLE